MCLVAVLRFGCAFFIVAGLVSFWFFFGGGGGWFWCVLFVSLKSSENRGMLLQAL